LRGKFELYIASRYLKAKRDQSFISVASLIAISGVALGVAALIIVLAMMTGMNEDIRDRLIGAQTHIIISKFYGFQGKGLIPDNRLYDQILSIREVVGVAPYIEAQVMIKGDFIRGIMLKGIDPEMEKNVSLLNVNMQSGSLGSLSLSDPSDTLPGIILGTELASLIGANSLGDEVKVFSFFNLKMTPFGEITPMKRFRVVGFFKSGYYDLDSNLGYIDIKTAQSFFLMGDRVNGIEVKIDNIYKVKKVSKAILEKIGEEYYARDWMEMNSNFYSALKLEKWGMFIMVLFLVIIAAFNIVTTLIMMVMEKNRDIGILRSMGACKKTVMRIFIFEGMIIGVLGTLIGLVSGIVICYVLDTYKLISLPQDIYYIAYLPFKMVLSEILIILVSSLVICFLATLYPSLKASRLDPVEAIRYE